MVTRINVGVAPASILIESRTWLRSESASDVRTRAGACVIITTAARSVGPLCVFVCVCACAAPSWIIEPGFQETQAGKQNRTLSPNRSEARRSGHLR